MLSIYTLDGLPCVHVAVIDIIDIRFDSILQFKYLFTSGIYITGQYRCFETYFEWVVEWMILKAQI